MIIKNKINDVNVTGLKKIGDMVENNVAFYLRREFSEDKDILVFNDLKITKDGENAQIDHLVIHKTGFVIIESKSIKGRITVNSNLEWSRTIGNSWSGMPSPIRQAELQSKLLKALLNDNAKKILPKSLGVQQYFGGRRWDIICACSSDAIIERENIPKKVSDKIIKAEFIAEKIKALIKRDQKLLSTQPKFNSTDMESITQFLLEKGVNTSIKGVIRCKYCNSISVIPMHGRFGYYVACKECNKNTSMKKQCSKCNYNFSKVTKSGNEYTLSCNCGNHETLLF